MSDFSLIGGGSDAIAEGLDLTDTSGTAITPSASSNTKGSWTELLSAASNDRPINGLVVYCMNVTGYTAQTEALIDVGAGGSGSEVVVAENLLLQLGAAATSNNFAVYYLPIEIGSGVRIAARCQVGTASGGGVDVHVVPVRGGLSSPIGASCVESLGADTANSDGTTVNVAGTTHTFGSWTEIASSTAEAYKGFLVAAHKINGSNSQARITYEVAVGAASSEEIIFSGHVSGQTTTEETYLEVTPFIPVQIPEGSRVSIRAQADTTNTDANQDYIIYGVR